MNKRIQEKIDAGVYYLDNMDIGKESTVSNIMDALGIATSIDELFDIYFGIFEKVDTTREYELEFIDCGDDSLEGLPFNYKFIKREKNDTNLSDLTQEI